MTSADRKAGMLSAAFDFIVRSAPPPTYPPRRWSFCLVSQPETEVSMLLQQVKNGDEEAREKLFVTLQSELRDMAGALMRGERPDHTLQATALVNEACVRLLDTEALKNVSDRRYMFGMANRAMRQILIDHARRRRTNKRGGDYQRASLDVVLDNFEANNRCQYEDLESALEGLEATSPRQREVVELRFFSGLTNEEVAKVLEISVATVERDWRLARAKLFEQLRSDDA
ncbi:RNA polymerase sigma-70 ECF-like protein [Rhodopirellula europaea 6C]|uniref:RNA polymerase sigma-70 ECF-like protein n=1 Tax=Rhodopirellula europaea 6C TaxID=1263867 RepID=M2B0Z0_9BACT|nr:RNA polymerase sigma-70 ECF-like protein [Rhodopirellula europaea 6C]